MEVYPKNIVTINAPPTISCSRRNGGEKSCDAPLPGSNDQKSNQVYLLDTVYTVHSFFHKLFNAGISHPCY